MNYQKELEKQLEQLAGQEVKTLFLHSCCAPCSSYVLTYLRDYFSITVFYYNPNITEAVEYRKREEEQKYLIARLNENSGTSHHVINWYEGGYEPQRFFGMAEGLEHCPEGGERCEKCFRLRLGEAAVFAKKLGMDFFTTTLTISPLKNAELLNLLGEQISKDIGVPWLPSDFKKKNGYRQSVELSAAYGLYRQDYCGCVYSKKDRGTLV